MRIYFEDLKADIQRELVGELQTQIAADDPGFPDRCSVRNKLLDSSSKAADNISHPSFTAILCPGGMVLCTRGIYRV